MSDKTKIQWADATFNPWIGCTKVSPGCANCYAEMTTRARVLRKRGHETWGKGKPRSRTSEATWKQPILWNREAGRMDGASENTPNVRLRIFPSLCDWLDNEVPIEWLADFLKLIYETPNLDWLLLTKRPENFHSRLLDVLRYLDNQFPQMNDDHAMAGFYKSIWDWEDVFAQRTNAPNYPSNVWIGTSVEDAPRKTRIDDVLKIPARVRFLSLEPLLGDLGDLGLGRINYDRMLNGPRAKQPWIDWVIAGGESGAKPRPCNVNWIRSIVEQCRAAGVAPFVKQLGSYPYDSIAGWKMLDKDPEASEASRAKMGKLAIKHKKGGDMSEWPEDLRVRQFPEVVR